MTRAIVYSKASCPHCTRAKKLLDQRGVSYEDRPIGLRFTGEQVREHCLKLNEGAQVNTVPQIILITDTGEERYIGGYAELKSMEW